MRQKPSKLEECQTQLYIKTVFYANFIPRGGGITVPEEVVVYFLLRMLDV